MTLSYHLQRLLRDKNMSHIAEALPVRRQAITKWRDGEALPTPDHLPLVASYLGVEFSTCDGEWVVIDKTTKP